VNEKPWRPRRGAPAAREGESPEQYTKRIRAERNRRHRESVKERALAASPAGKVAAAAAKPARTRTKAQAPAAPGSEPSYLPASVHTNTGRYTFDTADPDEIARIEAILHSEPGLEQIDPQTLHAALTTHRARHNPLPHPPRATKPRPLPGQVNASCRRAKPERPAHAHRRVPPPWPSRQRAAAERAQAQ
jgi:hypothetical protein